MTSAEIASAVAVLGLLFNYFGFTSIGSDQITGALNAVVFLVTFGAAVWSAWVHRQNSAAQQ